MQFEERYYVTTTTAEGIATSEGFDDMAEALEDYTVASRALQRGEKVALSRTTYVTLASAAKAR
ncbi:hypothetical protein ACIQMR_35480 [Streptomyces sp. NPDC091376]|uniref:hypothetical protein n=1 Tax=Streptomyces sp. NPDC091376 TaxID=3365994 RepID=UPI00380E0EF8